MSCACVFLCVCAHSVCLLLFPFCPMAVCVCDVSFSVCPFYNANGCHLTRHPPALCPHTHTHKHVCIFVDSHFSLLPNSVFSDPNLDLHPKTKLNPKPELNPNPNPKPSLTNHDPNTNYKPNSNPPPRKCTTCGDQEHSLLKLELRSRGPQSMLHDV